MRIIIVARMIGGGAVAVVIQCQWSISGVYDARAPYPLVQQWNATQFPASRGDGCRQNTREKSIPKKKSNELYRPYGACLLLEVAIENI